MKKRITIAAFITCLLLSTLLTGCHKTPKYTLTNVLWDYYMGDEEIPDTPRYYGIQTGEIGSEYNYNYYYNSFYQDSKVPQKRTVVINGVPVEGTYKQSSENAYEAYPQHRYVCSDKPYEVGGFDCNDKGDVVYFAYNYNGYYKKKQAPCFSTQEMEDIARDFLRQYVDIDSFRVASTDYTSEDDFSSSIRFVRALNGIDSQESVAVHILNASGKIWHYTSFNLGEYKNASVPVFDMEKVEKVVFDTLEKNYNSPEGMYYNAEDYPEPIAFRIREATYWKSPKLGWGLLILAGPVNHSGFHLFMQ